MYVTHGDTIIFRSERRDRPGTSTRLRPHFESYVERRERSREPWEGLRDRVAALEERVSRLELSMERAVARWSSAAASGQRDAAGRLSATTGHAQDAPGRLGDTSGRVRAAAGWSSDASGRLREATGRFSDASGRFREAAGGLSATSARRPEASGRFRMAAESPSTAAEWQRGEYRTYRGAPEVRVSVQAGGGAQVSIGEVRMVNRG